MAASLPSARLGARGGRGGPPARRAGTEQRCAAVRRRKPAGPKRISKAPLLAQILVLDIGLLRTFRGGRVAGRVVVKMRGEHPVDPLGVLEDALGAQQVEGRDL